MVLGVDAREICDRPAGKGQYLLRILWQLQQRSDVRLVLYTYENQVLPESIDGSNVTHIQQSGSGLGWHRAVAKRLNKDGVEVFFAALSYLSAIFNKVPTVTVVHDLAIFRLPGFSHNRKAQIVEKLTLRRCVARSAHMIAVSESTKRDLLELMKAAPEKISVVLEASLLGEEGKEQKPLPLEKRDSFFLFTGTLEPRKNISLILVAYAALPVQIQEQYRLKLAGKPGWGGQDYQAQAEQLGISAKVDFLGYVSDADLKNLYRTATLFLFPSLYEGFGLPVVEAMSMGTPVITSNVASLPEVVGEQGLTIDPQDSAAMARAIEDLTSNPAKYEQQSRYLYERSKTFRWSTIADEVLIILKRFAH